MTWALATIAVLVIVWAALSGRLKSRNVTAAMFFTAAGLLAGSASGLLDLSIGSEQVKLVAEATLTLVLFADASRISVRALRSEFTVPLRLLGHRAAADDRRGTLVGVAVLPGVSLPEALVLAVMLACTDAALGQAVVTDPRVPSRIRQGLNVESGLNDGLCVPLFFIAIALAEAEEGATSDPAGREAGVGADRVRAGRRCRRWPGRRPGAPPGHPPRLRGAALAPGPARGLGRAGGGDRDGARRQHLHRGLHGGLRLRRRTPGGGTTTPPSSSTRCGELLNGLTFIIFGAVILRPVLQDLSWELVLYALLSLTVVRMLPVAVAMIGTGARSPTLGFLGWFGPRGLASIVFGVILLDDANLPHEKTILYAVVVTVALSVFAHGLTAGPVTRRYVRWYQAHPTDRAPSMETVPAAEHRLRTPWTSRS